MATNNAAIVITAVNKTGSVLKQIAADVNKITKATSVLGSAMNRIKVAAQFYVLFRIFTAIKGAIDAVVGAIPNLIRRGDEWLRVLDNIQDATGMTAEQASKFAYAARVVGVDVTNVGRDLSYLARNVIENEQQFTKFGISVRNSQDRLKGSYEIFQSVRRALSQYGRQFMTAAAAQRIFSEGGRSLIDLLTLTDAQWKRLMVSARQSGAIMSQAAISSAEAWRRSQNMMQMQLDTIGAQILGGVAPVLIALTTGVTKAINKNMGSIVDFVQRVVVVVAAFFSGLFGIEVNFKAIDKSILDLFASTNKAAGGAADLGAGMDEAAGGTKKATGAIERQIDALDRQLKRLDRIEDRRSARREFQDLQRDIAEARMELSAIRGETIFASGMSAVEAELQRQAHTADIIAGEKRLADAKQKMRDFERQQEIDAERSRLQRLRDALQDRLSAITAAAAKASTALANSFQSMPQAIDAGLTKSSMKIKKSLQRLFKDVQKMGRDLSTTIMEAVFGKDIGDTFGFPKGKTSGPMQKTGDLRQGGLLALLKSVGDTITDLSNRFDVFGKLQDALDLFAGPGGPLVTALVNLYDWLRENVSVGHWVGEDTTVGTGYDVLAGKGPELIQKDFQKAQEWLIGIQKLLIDPFFVDDKPKEEKPKEKMSTGAGIYGAVGLEKDEAGPGAGVYSKETTRWQSKDQGVTLQDFREFWDSSSVIGRGLEDQTSLSSAIAAQTRPISDGTLGTAVTGWDVGGNIGVGVQNKVDTKVSNVIDTRVGNMVDTKVGNKVQVGHDKFSDIGKINRWNAGSVPVKMVGQGAWAVLDKRAATRGNQVITNNMLREIRNYIGWAGGKYASRPFSVILTGGRGYAAGSRYVPSTGPAIVHQGEAIISAAQVRQGAGGGGGNISIQLDARATRLFLSGRAVNTSTRPQMGT